MKIQARQDQDKVRIRISDQATVQDLEIALTPQQAMNFCQTISACAQKAQMAKPIVIAKTIGGAIRT